MKRTLLALGAVLLTAGLGRADYVVVIANLGANAQDGSGGGAQVGGMAMGGMIGMMGGRIGGSPSMPGGMGGRIGGSPSMPGGMIGMPGGSPSMPGGRMGGPPPTPGSMTGGFMGGGSGFFGGGPGMGFPGGASDTEEEDELATLVVVVLEVKCNTPGYAKLFEASQPLWFNHAFGGRAALQKKLGIYEVSLVTADGRPMPTVQERFQRQYASVFPEKEKSPEALLGLARKALEYGLLKSYGDIMDKLAEIDKDGPQVKTYKLVKEALAKPMPNSDAGAAWKDRMLGSYKVTQPANSHFALVHGFASDEAPEVKTRLDHLEKTFRGIYYWWADKGEVLPMPKARLVSVLVPSDGGEDFNKLKRHLASGPDISDSFYARREGLTVFSSRRSDDHFEKLEGATKRYWEDGFNRTQLLRGVAKAGIPRAHWSNDAATHLPRTAALMLKALETEWELNATTHEVARQIPFVTGMLAPKVHAPEWVQFGMGSLFEAPLQSPWHGIGVANSYYLPRFKENHKGAKYGDPKTDAGKLATLVGVVTDDYFRAKPKKGLDGKDESADAVQRRARAASWALTYYLAQNDLAGLQRYFKELSRLPRDVELDRTILLDTFARAFRCATKDGKADNELLKVLASRWLQNINTQKMEGEKIHEQVRKAYETVRRNPLGGSGSMPGTPGAGGAPPPPGGGRD